MKGLALPAILGGIIAAVIAVVAVFIQAPVLVTAEGWARLANLCFLFSIAVSLLPEKFQ